VQVQKCFALEKKLRAMDHEIMVNPQYVQKVRGLKSNMPLIRREAAFAVE